MTAARVTSFGGLEISFDDRVLEPRSWTLMQAEWAQEVERSMPAGPFLELGCGAGHIGLAAIAGNGRSIVQLDAEEAACDWARSNATRNGLADRVAVRCGSFDVALDPDERFALVIADPPYVPTSEATQYQDDPRAAIDGGADGLDGIRGSLRVAAEHLLPGGAVLLQAWGPHQVRQTEPVAAAFGLSIVGIRVHDDRRAVALLRVGV